MKCDETFVGMEVVFFGRTQCDWIESRNFTLKDISTGSLLVRLAIQFEGTYVDI